MKEIPVSLTSPAAAGRTNYRATATVNPPTGAGVEIAASSADGGLWALKRLRRALLDLSLISEADLLVVHDHTTHQPAAEHEGNAGSHTDSVPAAPTLEEAVGASGECAADAPRYAVFSHHNGRELQLSRWMPPLRARKLHDTLAASVSKNIYLLRHDDD